jgi:hypothetical protein
MAKKFMKIGTHVEFIRRNGMRATGRVARTDDKANGRWVAVNTAAKGKNPEVTYVRESKIRAV